MLLNRLIEVCRQEAGGRDIALALGCAYCAEHALGSAGSNPGLAMITATTYEIVLPAIYRGARESAGDVTSSGFSRHLAPLCQLLIRCILKGQPWEVQGVLRDIIFLLRTTRFLEGSREAEGMMEDPRLLQLAPPPQQVCAVLAPSIISLLGPIVTGPQHPLKDGARETLQLATDILLAPAIRALEEREDKDARRVAARSLVPSILQGAVAVGREGTCAGLLWSTCAGLLTDSEEGMRRTGLILLVDWFPVLSKALGAGMATGDCDADVGEVRKGENE